MDNSQRCGPARSFFNLLGLIFLVFTAMAGCDRTPEADTVVVDFEDVAPEAPIKAKGGKRLRAAAGAMVSPRETHSLYMELFSYVSRNVNTQLEFVQRKTYAEINRLFAQGQLDLAFICSGPYALAKKESKFELLVTPRIEADHTYRSYLIVNKDSPYQTLEDLKGTVFAFTDPDSNSGRLVPLHWLQQMGRNADTFFKKSIYTYSHDNSILAVARGLVDAAAVDSLIWDFMRKNGSPVVQETRIIKRSQPFGIPPLVVSTGLEPTLRMKLQDLLLGMHTTPEGRKILSTLRIERFILPKDSWYDSIRRINRTIETKGPNADRPENSQG
ncbi:MAG: phosphate/phosphite/phosphonate ABC transporter substrate-binding protein [Desulfohalobiaceae bacterium]|nr:phosphate/phosphite/phosphonate ABC transporter substrate-binding protein [Desulfohalobiaceae bacterium]